MKTYRAVAKCKFCNLEYIVELDCGTVIPVDMVCGLCNKIRSNCEIIKTTYCMSDCYLVSYKGVSVYAWTESEGVGQLSLKYFNKY